MKFIRDQANAALAVQKEEEHVKDRASGHTAQMAAAALRKTYAILKGDNSAKISVDLSERDPQIPGKIDPLDGWAEGVSLNKSDCCLLLKPQIILRGETPADSCVVAAAQAKLQSFNIMDDFNSDDPVNGKVMSRLVNVFKDSERHPIKAFTTGTTPRSPVYKPSHPPISQPPVTALFRWRF